MIFDNYIELVEHIYTHKLGKPRTIFVGSMCDMFGEWIPDEWIHEVFNACEAAPQHRYMFLTITKVR